MAECKDIEVTVSLVMHDCVDELQKWARSRIDECRRQEKKFDSESDAFIRAVQERQTLQAVLRILHHGGWRP